METRRKAARRWRLSPVLALVVAGACCQGAPRVEPRAGEAAPQPDGLPNGLYEVRAVSGERGALPPAAVGERVLAYDRRFVRGREGAEPDYVLLETEGFVPLGLAAQPQRVEQNGQVGLALRLADGTQQELAHLTSRIAGRGRLAVVIGGEIVSMHKVRMPLSGGALQVMC